VYSSVELHNIENNHIATEFVYWKVYPKERYMQISELREILIKRIQTIEDEDFLNAMRILTDSKVENPIYNLNEFERQKIAIARKQVENGEYTTQEEVFEKVNSWLKK
jgi:hypothetical protein